MDWSERTSIEAGLLCDPSSSGPKDVSALADAPIGGCLLAGFRRHDPTDYDKALCLIPQDVLSFIFATRPPP